MTIPWTELEAEVEAAAWAALDGPADEAAAKTVRRVVEARTHRWFGRVPGLDRVDVEARVLRGGIEVDVRLHVGTQVRRLRTVLGSR